MRHPLVFSLIALTTFACTPGTSDSGDSDDTSPNTTGCTAATADSTHLIISDIDETLTTADGEFLKQMGNPSYDPEMRPDANTLMNAYAERGWRIIYVTGRTLGVSLTDGTSGFDATNAWLTAHGFPRTAGDLHLVDAEGILVMGEPLVAYKAGVMEDYKAEGATFDWGYGNASTDVQAYQRAGLPDAHSYLVGKLADNDDGSATVQLIRTEDAYTHHYQAIIDDLDCAD